MVTRVPTGQCTRCLLPVVFRGIDLDDDGVCTLCNRYGPALEERIATETSEILTDAADKPAIVSVSGGKDSCAALAYLVEHYGNTGNLTVVTIDNGFLASTALENVARMVEAAGLEWVVIRAGAGQEVRDAYDKRENVCVVCARQYYRAVAEFARARRTDIVFTGREWLGAVHPHTGAILSYSVYHDSEPYTGIAGVRLVRLLAGLRMSLDDRYAAVEPYQWERPPTELYSNCLIQDTVVARFVLQHNYHPYALPIAEQLRRGMVTLQQARRLLATPATTTIAQTLTEALIRRA